MFESARLRRAYSFPPAGLTGLQERLTASGYIADDARAASQIVAERVDRRHIDLDELKAREVPEQVAKSPFKVRDRVLVKAVTLLRVDDLACEGIESLMAVGLRLAARHDRCSALRRQPRAARDLLEDRLQFDLCARLIPTLSVGSKDQPVTTTVGVEAGTKRDGLAVPPS